MQESIKQFIQDVKTLGFSERWNIYQDHCGWCYYYSISGYINDEYFCVYFKRFTEKDNHETEVANTTDCKKTIKLMLKKFGL
jgi:hypothetical protein